MNRTNFLIIGSGIAGLNFALHAAKKGHVTILTKKKVAESNTNYAQGGIAGVLDKLDSANQHIEDTFNAGARHGKKKAIKFMVEKSKEAITRLIELGVEFEKEHGKLKLTREGGHSHRRIAYVGDYTGQEIENILIKRVREHPNIEIVENAFALDLLKKRKTIYGASFTKNNNIDYIFADAVILATGGIGQLYQHTTNPKITTGDGIAMAIRAGATTKDLEFTQFHPTALNKRRTPLFLLSETLRGEGAKLKNTTGARFMHKHSPKLKELASRDIVARAIYSESKDGPVTLDISHKSRDFLKKRFPKIYAELRKYKLDLAKDLIPVIPAAHYTCGGIKTNLKGRTNLNRLFAFGEAACTGVHGANRLASNSLLEALVFSN
ncbi:L-aspartate oxidase, partial [Candidatus Peregrinibacteria bacterium]|nr:L-aspartate oxidase [Candidatus Peregrinibacteria bacterium]